jgi:two-component SAPR family response regulator
MKCHIVDSEEVIDKILDTLVTKTSFLKLIKNCSFTPEESPNNVKEKIGLIFLDVKKSEMKCSDLLKTIPGSKPKTY